MSDSERLRRALSDHPCVAPGALSAEDFVAYAGHTLPASDVARVRAHVEACDACALALGGLLEAESERMASLSFAAISKAFAARRLTAAAAATVGDSTWTSEDGLSSATVRSSAEERIVYVTIKDASLADRSLTVRLGSVSGAALLALRPDGTHVSASVPLRPGNAADDLELRIC